MLLNHFELDDAIQELKDEGPGVSQRQRVLDTLLKPMPMPLKRPLAALAAVISTGLILMLVFMRGSSIAWAEVLRKTQLATDLHITTFNEKGRVMGEQWRSGSKWAAWERDESGRIVDEDRSDNLHFYTYLYRSMRRAPNAIQYGTLWNETPEMLKVDEKFSAGPPHTIDALTRFNGAKLVSEQKADADGKSIERYVVILFGKRATVDADPQSSRILTIRTEGMTERFQYPESIDPKIFSYESRLTRNVFVLDVRGIEEKLKVPPYMPKVIASKDGIDLRDVSVSPDGDLYVFWTGYLPDKAAAKRLRVFGVRTGAVRWLGHFLDSIHPASRLICYRVELPEKIGNRVTIRIPTSSSYVEFKNVRIEKPHTPND